MGPGEGGGGGGVAVLQYDLSLRGQAKVEADDKTSQLNIVPVQQICVNLLTFSHPLHAPSTVHGTRTFIVKLTSSASTYMYVHVEHVLFCKSYLCLFPQSSDVFFF